jgi:hypothetical protein
MNFSEYLNYVDNDWARGWLQRGNSERVGVFVPRVIMEAVNRNPYDAMLLSQILYWSDIDPQTRKSRLRCKHGKHYWIVKTYAEWQEEVCLKSDRTVRGCFQRLEDNGFIFKEVHKSTFHNGQTACFVRLNWKKIEQVLGSGMTFTAVPGMTLEDTPETPLDVNPISETTTETTEKTLTAPVGTVGTVHCQRCKRTFTIPSDMTQKDGLDYAGWVDINGVLLCNECFDPDTDDTAPKDVPSDDTKNVQSESETTTETTEKTLTSPDGTVGTVEDETKGMNPVQQYYASLSIPKAAVKNDLRERWQPAVDAMMQWDGVFNTADDAWYLVALLYDQRRIMRDYGADLVLATVKRELKLASHAETEAKPLYDKPAKPGNVSDKQYDGLRPTYALNAAMGNPYFPDSDIAKYRKIANHLIAERIPVTSFSDYVGWLKRYYQERQWEFRWGSLDKGENITQWKVHMNKTQTSKPIQREGLRPYVPPGGYVIG